MRMDVYEIARKLGAEFGVPAAHVAAVMEVEAGGFYDPCQIRFEGHYFDERLGPADRERARKAGLASPKVGGVKNPKSQEARYKLLDRACVINRQAAIESTSWGIGQVMGAHWKALGFASINALEMEARSGLEGQARLMMRYVKVFGLLDELREGRWSAFARGYNGPGYRKNAYDSRMADAAARIGGRVAASDGMLRMGAKGAGVREIQGILARAGYAVKVDGDFGPATRDAVKALQGQLGLVVDGVVGPKTMSAFATYRVAPDEKVGRLKAADLPNVGKVATATITAATLGQAKEQIEGAASLIGGFAGHLAGIPSLSSAVEAAASGLVAIAGIVGVAALAYAGWEWVRSKGTYEGVAA